MPEDDIHHIRNVLRYKAGDQLFVFDGIGAEYRATIVAMGKSEVIVRLEEQLLHCKESPLIIRLFAALLREPAWDDLMNVTTQLGVTLIQPIFTERGVRSGRSLPTERWERILRAAAKQSGRSRIPQLAPMITVHEIPELDHSQSAVRLALVPNHSCQLKREYMPEVVDIAVGPEGGFVPEEINILMSNQFVPLGLGRRILRVETACAAALVLAQHYYGDMASGIHNPAE